MENTMNALRKVELLNYAVEHLGEGNINKINETYYFINNSCKQSNK